jgi:hypothetical protein
LAAPARAEVDVEADVEEAVEEEAEEGDIRGATLSVPPKGTF